jgi:hypothetical protein
MLVVSVGPVAADGLVTTVPGQDPNSPVQVVSSPGFVQSGAAQVPTGINGGLYGSSYFYGGQYYGNVGYPVNGGYYYFNGQYYDASGNVVSGVPTGVVPTGAYPGYSYGVCGYAGSCGVTAAGPIVGYSGNGAILVQDASNGDIDPYVVDPKTGKYCSADVYGNADKGTSCNP